MVAALAAGSLHAGPALAAPYKPADDAEILERLPAPADASRRELQEIQAASSGEPGNLDSALRLARRYIELGRAEADPRYYGYAEATLQPWLDLAEPPVDVVVLRAVLSQNRHAFDAAIADLDRVLAVRPGDAQAQLTRAFVLQAQGRLREAAVGCQDLPAGIEPLVVATCMARVTSLTGNSADAYLQLASALQGTRNADSRLLLWSLTNLAEIAERRGDEVMAERHFRTALNLGVRNTYLLGAYADFLLDQNRVEDVRRLLAGETRVDGLLLRLAVAEAATGDENAREHISMLDQRFAASRRRGDSRHLREEARFLLELRSDPAQALDRSLENWRTQREPADARLVLQAALAAGARDEAVEVLDWLEETGLEDARIASLIARIRDGEN